MFTYPILLHEQGVKALFRYHIYRGDWVDTGSDVGETFYMGAVAAKEKVRKGVARGAGKGGRKMSFLEKKFPLGENVEKGILCRLIQG